MISILMRLKCLILNIIRNQVEHAGSIMAQKLNFSKKKIKNLPFLPLRFTFTFLTTKNLNKYTI